MAPIKLKSFLLFFIACYLLSAASLSAWGKKDEAAQVPLNTNWLLCITAFDYSQLPASRRISGDVLTRDLVNRLNAISNRIRLSPEYAYYEGYAWQQALGTAAKNLANKYNERSQLVYKGDPNWKYRVNLKKIDADIKTLEEAYLQKEAEKPLIESAPVFALIQSNIGGTYPAPPQPGGERRFCQSQKADAILSGQMREFHDRYYISLQLFTLYTDSWVYEDDIIFSLDDTEEAVEEITTRLSAVLSGSRPASIAVTASPSEAQVLINQSYAGRGTVAERQRPPGNVSVAVAAEGYSPLSVDTELASGELTRIDVNLSPLYYSNVEISVTNNAKKSAKNEPAADAPSATKAAIYNGALYVGEAPYILRLPVDQLNYIKVENWKGETGKAVFTSPDMPDESSGIAIKTRIPPPSGQRRVNKARGWYYWAWAGTWITGITAWLTYGIYTSQNNALPKSADPAFFDKAQRMQYISSGAMIAVGAAVANEIFWMARYIHTSTDDAVPIVRNKKDNKK